ncbi:MAG TPA: argininosuccinate lyase [Polyangiaceae bacterium]|jgi:argininosuccinate lyase|nr:argininosuccinate lyase [Polyangiaceae bacterium]
MTVARGGRLSPEMSASMTELNTSVHIDSELWREDIEGSLAHVRGLEAAGVISADEASKLALGLESVATEIREGRMQWDAAREDVHMNVEARLSELVGPVGGKLHTGRSRNDQVATDLRLWTRRKIDETLAALDAFAAVLLDVAAREIDVLMPAYTHMQRGQPSRLSHHVMAWQELLYRDRGRLVDARVRVNESPLGAGAVAATGFPVDREAVAKSLAFDHAMRNSIDATGSRDFLMETASALAVIGVHLSRIGEELVIWSTTEFGFVALSDQFSTSSSMMPQKKNPDVAELVRGKAARIIGSVTALYVLEKSLPFGYGRDLQEDKRPIFDAFEAALVSLRALSGAIATATFRADRLTAALERGHLCATDLADFLVLRRVPFREAHHIVGGLVAEAERRGVELGELPKDVLVAAHSALGDDDVKSALDPKQAVERRSVKGGPAKVRVLEAIADARARWTR